MSGIKATNSRGLRVINCTFNGFETDIELENCEDFVSSGNIFSRNPQQLLNSLIDSIQTSSLSPEEQSVLFQEIIGFLKSGAPSPAQQPLIAKVAKYIGDKAVDLLIQLSAAVVAGLIIR